MLKGNSTHLKIHLEISLIPSYSSPCTKTSLDSKDKLDSDDVEICKNKVDTFLASRDPSNSIVLSKYLIPFSTRTCMSTLIVNKEGVFNRTESLLIFKDLQVEGWLRGFEYILKNILRRKRLGRLFFIFTLILFTKHER